MTTDRTATNRLAVPSKQKWVPLSLMEIRPEAQRELNRAWADHIATDIDVEKIGVFVVNYIGGHYWLIDGQHRKYALETIGWGDQQVQAQVFEGLTSEQEAELFLGLNDRKAIPALQSFRIAVFAGREREVAIDTVVRAQECVVGVEKVPGAIGAVGTLIRIYDRAGPKVLARTIRICRDAWGDSGLDANVLDGIGMVCARFNGDLEDQLAVAKLGNVHAGVGGFMGRVYLNREKWKKPVAQCVAATAVEIINAGRGGKKLPGWWREEEAA